MAQSLSKVGVHLISKNRERTLRDEWIRSFLSEANQRSVLKRCEIDFDERYVWTEFSRGPSGRVCLRFHTQGFAWDAASAVLLNPGLNSDRPFRPPAYFCSLQEPRREIKRSRPEARTNRNDAADGRLTFEGCAISF